MVGNYLFDNVFFRISGTPALVSLRVEYSPLESLINSTVLLSSSDLKNLLSDSGSNSISKSLSYL